MTADVMQCIALRGLSGVCGLSELTRMRVAGYKMQGRTGKVRKTKRRAAHARPSQAHVREIEVLYLPGLQDVVLDELSEHLSGSVRRLRSVPGHDDSIAISMISPLKPLFRLRTVVAPFLVLSFPVPRPRSLLSGEYLSTMVEAIREVIRLNPSELPKGLRIEAAGRDRWDVLVRLSTLPLSARPWRVEGYHAAANATVRTAMVRLSRPAPKTAL